MREKNTSRRERERMKRREDILRAAKTIFAREGFEGTNLDKIAARCELAKGTIYYYFDSKEQLFSTVLEEVLNEIIALVDETMELEGTRARIRKLLEDLLVLFKRDHKLFLVFFREKSRFEGAVNYSVKSLVFKKFRTIICKIGEIFRQGIELGEIKGQDPVELSYLVVGLIHIFALKLKYAPEEGAELLTSILFDGVKKYPEMNS